MKVRFIYLLFSIFLLPGISLNGQSKKDYIEEKKSFIKKEPLEVMLNRAQNLRQKEPQVAISILEEVIANARKRDRINEGKAYILLGDIYRDINQNDLAVERYSNALNIFNSIKKNITEKTETYSRLGDLFLEIENIENARTNYILCIDYAIKDDQIIRCKEGLISVHMLEGNLEESMNKMDSIQTEFDLDSISTARIEAQRSQNFILLDNYPKASEAFRNSISNIPKLKKISKEDYKPIEDAQNGLLNYNLAGNEDKRSISEFNISSNAITNRSSDLLINEYLNIASLYKEENNLTEAVKFIERSKDVIDINTSKENEAEVFKQSYEINRLNGKLDNALIDLEKYIAAKELSIDNLEKDLSNQIEVVKGQKKIDIGRKEYDLDLKDKAYMQSQLVFQKIIIGLLSLLLLASAIFFYFLQKNVKSKRRANQLLYIKSLRTQMNPHFIFNALNSVNNFIAKNDEKAANKFLSDFSKLMRKVLDYSEKDFIDVDEELELNELYLKLEQFRFRDKFEYSFTNNLEMDTSDIQIPPMLIQPLIENAVWHGLRYKEEKGKLDVDIKEENENIIVTVSDNGIGREKSKALKTNNQRKYKSTGLENISKRLDLINKIYKKNYQIEISDLNSDKEDQGTKVLIKIPRT